MTMIDPKQFEFREYVCQEDGLTFTVRLYQTPSGSFEAKITVYEGSADFNALFWGDNIDDGNSFGFGGGDKNLNMNGGGQVAHDGKPVDWDAGIKLSSPGKIGANKPTYLTEGDYFTVALDGITSLDQIENIGLRATSTSTPEGSIKCVLEPVGNHDAADSEDQADDATNGAVIGIGDITLPQEPVADATEEPTAEEPAGSDALPDDFAAFYNSIATQSEADVPPPEDEFEEPMLVLM